MIAHRLAAISFRLAIADCTCGAEVHGDREATVPRTERRSAFIADVNSPEALADAWLRHRRESGETQENVTISYGNSDVPWNGKPLGRKAPKAT